MPKEVTDTQKETHALVLYKQFVFTVIGVLKKHANDLVFLPEDTIEHLVEFINTFYTEDLPVHNKKAIIDLIANFDVLKSFDILGAIRLAEKDPAMYGYATKAQDTMIEKRR